MWFRHLSKVGVAEDGTQSHFDLIPKLVCGADFRDTASPRRSRYCLR